MPWRFHILYQHGQTPKRAAETVQERQDPDGKQRSIQHRYEQHLGTAPYLMEVRRASHLPAAHYTMFRKYVRNTIDWDEENRHEEIWQSLDSLLEAGSQRASEAAESCRRWLPYNGTGTSGGKKNKSSSSRTDCRRIDSVHLAQLDGT
ncbi:hypothetical protein N0V90_012895 [Kalmusia sp. IMI 367209]|nr:hypothetical protein N0V90_012895 [Kalmusia sp. IMI 367209]